MWQTESDRLIVSAPKPTLFTRLLRSGLRGLKSSAVPIQLRLPSRNRSVKAPKLLRFFWNMGLYNLCNDYNDCDFTYNDNITNIIMTIDIYRL